MGKGKRKRGSGDGWQTHGPPMRTVSGRMSSGSPANDEWQTTRRTWAQLAPALRAYTRARVWMPFYYDGECASHMRSLGFEHIIHADDDFFAKVSDAAFMEGVDVIVDNPPYTAHETKERVLRALAASGKPFVMLLPMSIVHVAFVRDILDMRAVQLLVPRRVYVRKASGPELPFKYLVWLCYKTGFERDLEFLADDEEVGDGGVAEAGPRAGVDAADGSDDDDGDDSDEDDGDTGQPRGGRAGGRGGGHGQEKGRARARANARAKRRARR